MLSRQQFFWGMAGSQERLPFRHASDMCGLSGEKPLNQTGVGKGSPPVTPRPRGLFYGVAPEQ